MISYSDRDRLIRIDGLTAQRSETTDIDKCHAKEGRHLEQRAV